MSNFLSMNRAPPIILILIACAVTEISSENYEHVTDCILDRFQRDIITFVCDPNKEPITFVNQSEIYCRYYQTLPKAVVKENGLPKINFRNCHLVQLETLLQWNRDVQVLDIQFSGLQQITSTDFQSVANLSTLDASKNKLETLPSSLFRYTTRISKVNFSANKIALIDTMAFEGASNLGLLDLSKNLIRRIDSRTFAKLNKLESLDLSSNLLTNLEEGLFDDLIKLNFLVLSKNSIAQLQCSLFANLWNLHALYVNENDLQEFNASCIRSRNTIYLSIEGNKLTNLTLLPNMRDVYASANRLKWITVDRQQDLPQLIGLNVSNNRIENIPQLLLSIGSNLKDLDVSDSPVGALNSSTLAKFKRLSFLSLRNTSLSYIANDAFRNQHDLVSLDLSNNNLKKIDFEMADWHLENLQFFHLDGNMLRNLDHFSRMDLPQLRYLSINNNNFSCGHLADFVQQLENRKISTEMPGSVRESDGQSVHRDGINGIACYKDRNAADKVSMVNVKLLVIFGFFSSYVYSP